MVWVVGSLSVVVAVYLGVIYWLRGGAKWGLGAALVVLVTMGLLLWLTDLLSSAMGVPYFVQIWIAAILWLVVTLVAGIKTDSIFQSKLPAARTT